MQKATISGDWRVHVEAGDDRKLQSSAIRSCMGPHVSSSALAMRSSLAISARVAESSGSADNRQPNLFANRPDTISTVSVAAKDASSTRLSLNMRKPPLRRLQYVIVSAAVLIHSVQYRPAQLHLNGFRSF
jgi:hypothetical protein